MEMEIGMLTAPVPSLIIELNFFAITGTSFICQLFSLAALNVIVSNFRCNKSLSRLDSQLSKYWTIKMSSPLEPWEHRTERFGLKPVYYLTRRLAACRMARRFPRPFCERFVNLIWRY